jgi:hypothetical protein
MAVSRMIYMRKLVETFPDQPRMDLFWVRDFIAPRFFEPVYKEFVAASKLGDTPSMQRAWADIQELVPLMKDRVRRKMKWRAPIINWLYLTPFNKIARSLLHNAVS